MIMQTHTEAPTAVPTRRAHSLDALRGYAIMTMILAATEAFGILPAWMYHAQEPPPTHVFNPHIYGITWVDLIFPFFLFSMGAAIPLSLGRQLEKGTGKLKLLKKTIIRWMKLTFFAIFVIHVYPYMLGYPAPWMNELVAIAAFALMFLIFMRNPFHLSKWGNRTMNTLVSAQPRCSDSCKELSSRLSACSLPPSSQSDRCIGKRRPTQHHLKMSPSYRKGGDNSESSSDLCPIDILQESL